MPTDSSARFVLLNHLAEEFADRYRRGERPSLQEYIDQHPDLAEDIGELFPAMVAMEQVKDDRHDLREPTADRSSPLERLGDFRILREIGHGGMGVVYEAEQLSLGRHVALKVLPRKVMGDACMRLRFEREAKAAARLHHTNIVPVFGVGEHEGHSFYAMQFIQGQPLDQVITELKRMWSGQGLPAPAEDGERPGDVSVIARSLLTGKFEMATEPATQPPEAAPAPRGGSSSSLVLPGQSGVSRSTRRRTYWHSVAQIGTQVADALEYAHKMGVIHRDIKPSNLLLDTAGIVWVTDFGLAKADDQENLTQTGDILGTLRYMPPEAFDGKSGARSDVYSLGLTLYELLALRPAFEEQDRARLIKLVTTGEPLRLRRLTREIPRDLETIVLKATAREAQHRYATAGHLADDLRRFLEDRPIQARRTPWHERSWRWCRRNPVLAVLWVSVLLTFAVGAGVSAYYAGVAEQKATDADLARKDATERLFQSLVSQAEAGLTSRRFGQRFKTLQAIRDAAAIRKTPELRNLAISALALPDVEYVRTLRVPPGTLFAAFDVGFRGCSTYDTAGNVVILDATSGTVVRRLPPFGQVVGIGLSPDGRWVSVHGAAGRTQVFETDGDAGPVFDAATDGFHLGTWSSDSKWAFGRMKGRSHVFEVPSWKSVADTALPQITAAAFRPGHPHLAVLIGTEVVLFHLPTWQRVAVLDQKEAPTNLAWHPDGNRLAVSTLTRLHLWDVSRGIKRGEVQGDTSGGNMMSFSPDGCVLVSNGWAGHIRFTNVEPFQPLFTIPGASVAGYPTFGPGNLVVGLPGGGNEVPIHRFIPSREYLTFEPPEPGFIVTWAVHPRGRWWVTTAVTGSVLEVRDMDGRVLNQVALPARVRSIQFGDDGSLCTNTFAGLFRWPVTEDASGGWTVGPPQRLRSFGTMANAASDDGRYVLSYTPDNRVAVYPVADPSRAVYLGEGRHGGIPAFSPDGRVAITNTREGVIAWDTRTGKSVGTVETPSVRPQFSRDGRHVLLMGGNTPLTLVETATWRKVREYGPAYSGVVSPDGSQIAYEEGQTTIRLIDTGTGGPIARFVNPENSRGQPFFSPDGSQLYSPRIDGNAVFRWDLRLIRAGLAELGLDWDAPAFAPAPTGPVAIRVVGAERLAVRRNTTLDFASALLRPWTPGRTVTVADYLGRAGALASLGWFDLALRDYEAAIRTDAKSADARLHRGLERFRRGQWMLASEDFSVVASDPKHPYRGTARLRLAWANWELGRPAEGMVHLDALLTDPGFTWQPAHKAGILLFRAEFYDRAGKPDLARADREAAAGFHANLAEAANIWAWYWLTPPPTLTPTEHWRFAPAALTLARFAADRAPGESNYLNTLGVALYRTGKCAEARNALEKSLRVGVGKSDGFDLYFLAMCHVRLSDRKAARDCYVRAVKWTDRQRDLSPTHLEELKAFRAEAEWMFWSRYESSLGVLGLSDIDRATAVKAVFVLAGTVVWCGGSSSPSGAGWRG